MSRRQVVVGRNGLQIWRLAANILNKQSQAANKGWSSRYVVARGAKNSLPVEIDTLWNFTHCLGVWQIYMQRKIYLFYGIWHLRWYQSLKKDARNKQNIR